MLRSASVSGGLRLTYNTQSFVILRNTAQKNDMLHGRFSTEMPRLANAVNSFW